MRHIEICRYVVAAAAILHLAAPPAAGQEGLEEARDDYHRSQRAGISQEERLDWLHKSLATYPTYRAHYEAGTLYRETGDLEAAVTSFESAFDLTDQDPYLARAAYQIGVTLERIQHIPEARRWLRRSLSFSDRAEVRDALRGLELNRKGRLISAAEILDEIEVERSFGVAKAELRVHFELNQARLDEFGRRQTGELGKALRDRRWSRQEQTFLLLGHTDLLCPRNSPEGPGCDRYNLDLSRLRAATVREVLIDRFDLPAAQVQAVGCGRQHLLSQRISEDDHYLNRRVVVMVLDPREDDWERLCSYGAGLL